MLKEAREHGVGAQAKYGTFILDDCTGETTCGHIDGHDPLTETAECRKFWNAETHTSAERWEEIECGKGAGWWQARDGRERCGAPPYEVLMGYRDDQGPCGTGGTRNNAQPPKDDDGSRDTLCLAE